VNTNMLPEAQPEYEALIPVGRLGKPEEIASVVSMLVGNAYMTNKVRSVTIWFTG
jgi:3-oxoacyl-[acyl-carrier protein] reductase